ncbi:MAG: hypothetical protein IKU36_11500 [Bacteroidales bacterium]|nr:hypothetical protein [Bacteroidales bacterium]
MKEEQASANTQKATVQTGGKRLLKRGLKALLWIGGIWLALLIILQMALSPAVLSKVVDKLAPQYIDGDLSFSKIKISMFRHFPNVGIALEDGALTYPADRFDSLELKGAQGRLLYQGCGETADTLASFRHFSIGINIPALIAGKISIPHVALVKPRIFAHSYDSLNANWNIFRFESEEDTASTVLPPISVGRIRLTNHPHIVYTDSEDTLFALIDVKRMTFNGKLDTKSASRNRIGLTVDSLMVAGRLAADTIGLGLNKLHIHEHNDHMDLNAEAKALLATRSFGRIHVPISIKGTAGVSKDSVPVLAMHGFKAEIAAIPISFDADLRKADGHLEIDSRFSVDSCLVEDMIDGFVKNFIPEAAKIKTDAAIFLDGTCHGTLGNGKLPSFDATLTVPQAGISHKDIRHAANLDLMVNARTDKEDRINVTVGSVGFHTYGLHLKAKGSAEDLLGKDPLFGVDGKFFASADSLLTFLPEDSGITASGVLATELKGSMKLSQMNIYNFAQADLTGSVASEGLTLKSPEDTIDVSLGAFNIKLGPETKTSAKNPDMTFKLLALTGSIAGADISLKDAITAKGEEMTFSAKNSVNAFSSTDTTRVHPFGGHVNAKSLVLEDAEGMSITLDNTANNFQMMPKRGHSEIPVLDLSSANKRIYLRNESGRVILTDASLKGRAVLNTVERRQRRRALTDSLMAAHPGVPRDSIQALLRSERRARQLPSWMTEDDFRAKDISFKLDGSLAKYFREWDMNCDLDVRTGILMTPYLPLRNIFKGIDVSLNNNELKIDSFKINAGESEITAQGSLSGLRRALLGRGTYNLELTISSEKMNADELLAAYNTGASYVPPVDSESLEDVSDSEFLKMSVADSLDTEGTNALIVIPSNLNADIRIDAGNIQFSDLFISEFDAAMVMKERCVQIVDSKAVTNMGTAEFEGFYATRTKQDIRTGFNFNISDVTTEKVIAMMPAIDTIMPLLNSFKGLVDCEIAATASLDTCMNVLTPTINGVIRIEGENLIMSDNEVFSSLAKKLKFKNKKEGKIDKMTVEGVIKDNTLEVFPFVVELDRYTLALSGLQNLDMSFKYHVSIIRSPLVFKIGVDLYGPEFDQMKFKIGKPKYKNINVPVFTTVIDETRINLVESIHNIFEKGVELAVKENEKQEAIEELRQQIGYVNAAEQQIEELSAEEQKQLEEAQEETTETTDGNEPDTTITETTDDNEQSGIH